jgi:hypothetical protein
MSCRTRKCAKERRAQKKAQKEFNKEETAKCRNSRTCSKRLFNKSEYKTLYENYRKCSEEKCH